jgi:DNA-binding response OmpR family regulator
MTSRLDDRLLELVSVTKRKTFTHETETKKIRFMKYSRINKLGRWAAANAHVGGIPSIRVLVAEDDALIRQIICRVLVEDGIAVDAASDGEQAWDALNLGHYDLLVTDNDMPRLTGIKLIERIRKAGIGLPIIIESGSFAEENTHDYPCLQFAVVISKPFGKLEFLNVVRNVLSSYGDTRCASSAMLDSADSRESESK